MVATRGEFIRALLCLAGLYMAVSNEPCAHAEETPVPTGSSEILPEGAKVEKLWGEGDFTEGVAAGPDGLIYFSDIAVDNPKAAGRIMKFDPATGKTAVHCADSAKSNGLFFDKTGRLIACCGALYGAQALVEILPDGKLKPLVEKFEGKKFNAPNDLVIDQKGRIWFSDPRYLGPEPLEIDHQSVYRLDPDGTLTRATTTVAKPNGVHVSPDGKTLYVAETDSGTNNYEPGKVVTPGKMQLHAFPIQDDSTLGESKVLVDFGDQLGIDGMTIDVEGNIYAAVRSPKRNGITVYTPEGKELAYIPVPELPTNCDFGLGDQKTTLYITAGHGFYRIPLKKAGYKPALPK